MENYNSNLNVEIFLTDDESGDDDDTDEIDGTPTPKIKKEIGNSSVKCTLDKRTQLAVELFFNNKMFEDQMVSMDLGESIFK